MKTIKVSICLGLFSFFMIGFGINDAQGQILKGITDKAKDGGNVVTSPIKDARATTKDITQPIKDVRKASKDITRPVKDVKKEVDGLNKDIDRAGNDIKKAKEDVGLKGKKNKDGDTAKADSTEVDEKLRPKRQWGTHRGEKKEEVVEDAPNVKLDSSRVVLLPPETIEQRYQRPAYSSRSRSGNRSTTRSTDRSTNNRSSTRSTDRSTTRSSDRKKPDSDYQSNPRTERTANNTSGNLQGSSENAGGNTASTSAAGAGAANSGIDLSARDRRMRYARSPARQALERADFEAETLGDLYAAAIWSGPDSVHTARSISYMLKQYRFDINEIIMQDPDWDVSGMESKYRMWNALFKQNTMALKSN